MFTLFQYLIPLATVTLVHSAEWWGIFPDRALLLGLPLLPWQCIFEFSINCVVHGLPHGSEADEDAGAGQQPLHKSNRHDHNYVTNKVLIAAVTPASPSMPSLKSSLTDPRSY